MRDLRATASRTPVVVWVRMAGACALITAALLSACAPALVLPPRLDLGALPALPPPPRVHTAAAPDARTLPADLDRVVRGRSLAVLRPRTAGPEGAWADAYAGELLFELFGRGVPLVDLTALGSLRASSKRGAGGATPLTVEGSLDSVSRLGRVAGADLVLASHARLSPAEGSAAVPLRLGAPGPGDVPGAAPDVGEAATRLARGVAERL